MKCFFDDNEAVGVCRFCGRATCKAHAEKRMPYISTIYVGASNTPKAVVVADALRPIHMPTCLFHWYCNSHTGLHDRNG